MVALDGTAPGASEAAGEPTEDARAGPGVPEELGAAPDAPPIVAPHSPQKRSPASAGAWQDGHSTASDPPH